MSASRFSEMKAEPVIRLLVGVFILSARRTVTGEELGFNQLPSHVLPFGPEVSDEHLPWSLDGGVGPLQALVPMPFYRHTFSDLYISPNGAISFGVALTSYLPSALPYQTYPAIFPFWADVNLWERTGDVYFRQTEERPLLDNITRDVNVAFNCHVGFSATWALIVTWHNVTFYREDFLSQPWPQTSTNTFQAVIASDQIDTFVIFNYVQIDWTAGQDSGGGTAGVAGAVGTPALVGFNAGDNIRSYVISNTTAANMALLTNTNVTGQWVFIAGRDVIGPDFCRRQFCVCKLDHYDVLDGVSLPTGWGYDDTPLQVPVGYNGLSKHQVADDPCRFDLRVGVGPKSLKRVNFAFGIQSGGKKTFNRKLDIGPDYMTEEFPDGTTETMTLPYEITTDDGLTHVTLEWETSSVLLLQSTTCPFYFRFLKDATKNRLYFYAGELGVDMTPGTLEKGMCGTCNGIPGE